MLLCLQRRADIQQDAARLEHEAAVLACFEVMVAKGLLGVSDDQFMSMYLHMGLQAREQAREDCFKPL